MSVDGGDHSASQHVDQFVSCRRVVVGHETQQVADVTTQARRSASQIVVHQLTNHALHITHSLLGVAV